MDALQKEKEEMIRRAWWFAISSRRCTAAVCCSACRRCAGLPSPSTSSSRSGACPGKAWPASGQVPPSSHKRAMARSVPKKRAVACMAWIEFPLPWWLFLLGGGHWVVPGNPNLPYRAFHKLPTPTLLLCVGGREGGSRRVGGVSLCAEEIDERMERTGRGAGGKV